MAGWAVFLSYVEATHDDEARHLKVALEAAGISTFRFKEDVPSGEPFGSVLSGALLDSRVVVAFLDAAFLERPNCRWEVNAVLAAGDLEARLVVARPKSDSTPNGLAGVPPVIANRRWPRADGTADLVALVQKRLAANPPTLAEALGESSARELRTQMLEISVLPAPELLTDIPHAPDPLPASIEDAFVGRAEVLWRIDHALRLRHGLGRRVRSTVALEGGGGTGKTRLAREYVRRYGSHYRGGIYWIDGGGPVDEQLDAVLRVLDPAVPDLVELRKSGIDVAGYLRRTFEARRPTGPVLWIVDNLPEARLPASQPRNRPSIASWCPLQGEVALLITSRLRVSLASPNIERIHVGSLPAAEALDLLVRGIDNMNELTASQWAAVRDWVGRLPLALSLLNAIFRAGVTTPTELHSRVRGRQAITPLLRDSRATLKEAGLVDLEPEVMRGVLEAFGVSYCLLDQEAQALARLLSELAPDPLPDELFLAIGPSVATPRARTELISRSFVEPAPGGPVPHFGQMHPVLADFLRNEHRASQEERHRLLEGILGLFDRARLDLPEAWPGLRALQPHAANLCDTVEAIESGRDLQSALELRLRMAKLAFFVGDRAAARAQEQRVLAARTTLLGPDHSDTLDAGEVLLGTLLEQGDYPAARTLAERILEARTRLLGREHIDTLIAAADMAAALYAQGDFPIARTHEEHVLQELTQRKGFDDDQTLAVADALAATLDALGDYKAARAMAQRVHEVRLRLLGPDHPGTLSAASRLGGIVLHQGDHQAALALAEGVLEIRTRVLGPDHPDTLSAANNVAAVLFNTDPSAARNIEERVLAIRSNLVGPEHPNTLTGANNLADSLREAGDYRAARALAERVLEARTRLLGPDHPASLDVAFTLTSILAAVGDYAAASLLARRVLDARTRLLGPEHPDTISAVARLAGVLYSERRYSAALVYFQQVLEARTRLLEPEHPHTLASMTDTANTLFGLGDYEAARAIEVRVLEARTRLLGRDDPESLRATNNLARTLVALGQKPAARALARQVLEARSRMLGADHPSTLESAGFLRSIGREWSGVGVLRALWPHKGGTQP